MGFTIVELLVVIVVIGILAAISIVAYSGIQARAADSSNASKAETLVKAIELYRVDSGTYPKNFVPGGSGLTDSTGSWPLANMLGLNRGALLSSGAAAGTTTSIMEACSYPDSIIPTDGSKFGYCASVSSGLSCFNNDETCVSFRFYYRKKSNGQLVQLSGGN